MGCYGVARGPWLHNGTCGALALQYVAPEVVTGFGDVSPTEVPCGKECDLWSLGVASPSP